MPLNKSYSADYLRRYHEGKLTPGEMHALEKAALEDPFLADALEGYKNPVPVAEDLEELAKRLHKKTDDKKKKIVFPGWMKVAALLLLFAGSGYLVYSLFRTPETNIAILKKPSSAAKSTEPVTMADSIATTSGNSQPINNFQDSNKEAAITYLPAAKEKIKKVNGKQTGVADSAFSNALTAPVTMAAPSSSTANGIYKDNKTFYSFKGRITDSMGQPLVNSVVYNRGNNKLAVTDNKGYFNLNVADSQPTVDITAVGYESKRETLNNNAENNIALKESNASLQEVVVTGISARKKSAVLQRKSSPVVIEDGEPEEGSRYFEEYVVYYFKNHPEPSLHNEKVKLSFTIDQNGAPENITVLETSCILCAEEAIKMLKEGPKWKKKNKKAKITITLPVKD